MTAEYTITADRWDSDSLPYLGTVTLGHPRHSTGLVVRVRHNGLHVVAIETRTTDYMFMSTEGLRALATEVDTMHASYREDES